MEKLEFNIKLTIYFEIKDAEIYGGPGTIGYMSSGIEIAHLDYEKDNPFNQREIMEKYIADQTKGVAAFAKVPVECVRLISKEEYEISTDED